MHTDYRDIFTNAGFDSVRAYPYWNYPARNFDFDAMMKAIEDAPEKSVFVLHASAHNPTGIDPDRDQWKKIAASIKTKNHLAFFDCAYQGFATGDLDDDAWPVRYFASLNIEMFVSQSFGKNMGLYGERIGYLACVVNDPHVVEPVKSQLTLTVRAQYSNPAGHGCAIVGKILAEPRYKAMWEEELKGCVDRVKDIRKKLRGLLEKLAPNSDWADITEQIGMFYFSKLTAKQGEALAEDHHVYILPSTGRINIGAVTDKNVESVAKAIASVSKIAE